MDNCWFQKRLIEVKVPSAGMVGGEREREREKREREKKSGEGKREREKKNLC